MKFAATLFTTVVGLTAMVAAIPQASTITSAPTSSVSIYVDQAQASTLSCIKDCGPGNVYCQAACQGLPTPDETALNATHDCVAACPPGGDEAKNAAWAACQQKCINSLYYTASGTYSSYVIPTAAGFSSSSAPAAETTDSTATDASKPAKTSGSSSGSGTTTGGSNPTQSPNAGSFNLVNMPMLGALGIFLGALAL
jgi:hypothetical protein